MKSIHKKILFPQSKAEKGSEVLSMVSPAFARKISDKKRGVI